MAKIIISYRRSDSDVFAGRVHDRIVSRYGDQSAFIDVDNIPFGKDFRVHIQEELASADAVLVIVGPKWLGSARGGRSRILDATDPVRIEVETALSRGIPTIPILVAGTSMPKPEQLPETLKDFSFLNAAPVDTSRDFPRDLNRVIATIDRILRLPLDKSDDRVRADDDHRVSEAKAEGTADIARQTERDRIASEAEAARRRDDDERQKLEAEARQRESERRREDAHPQETEAVAQRLAEEHSQTNSQQQSDHVMIGDVPATWLVCFLLAGGGFLRSFRDVVANSYQAAVDNYVSLFNGAGTLSAVGEPWQILLGVSSITIAAGLVWMNFPIISGVIVSGLALCTDILVLLLLFFTNGSMRTSKGIALSSATPYDLSKMQLFGWSTLLIALINAVAFICLLWAAKQKWQRVHKK